MESFYSIALLFLFAVVDLFVGVSNDAVNFLNSAIGSRVASRRIILLVASIGILAGALLSNGMMEVVRKGIFNPGHFSFSEITVIFTAVMIADILLLDFFNTIGLPTSTTVSVVFELFGAAVFTAVLKLMDTDQAFSLLGHYINTGKALVIISGILLSVVAAFALGAFVQYLSRILFSFHYRKRYNFAAALWVGLAMTAMCYFLVYKGMKGTYKVVDYQEVQAQHALGKAPVQGHRHGYKTWSFGRVVYYELHPSDGTPIYLSGNPSLYWATRWVHHHLISVLGGFSVFWTLFTFLLIALGIDVLRIVVLFGTFCLAMAFAGNDLVNFIGIPIAGYQSYHLWAGSGLPPQAYPMQGLAKSVPIPTFFLFVAALIMILTLWFSEKARSVTETEVNLARQREGEECFSASVVAQNTVKAIRNLGRNFFSLFPKRFLVGIERNFKADPNADPTVAFDLVRASVNLTVASILIALATSYKLPLSTTYVSFMVAMGASLSDRAWDRESAVYRVSGVLQVISGWFLTAFIAFFTAGLLAVLVYYFHLWALLTLTALASFALYRSALSHRRKRARKAQLQAISKPVDELTLSLVIETAAENLSVYTEPIRLCYASSLAGLFEEKAKLLKRGHKKLKHLEQEFEAIRSGIYKWIKRANTDDPTPGGIYIQAYGHFGSALRALRAFSDASYLHFKNSHKPLSAKQKRHLHRIRADFEDYLKILRQKLSTQEVKDTSALEAQREVLLQRIDQEIQHQVRGMIKKKYGAKNSHTVFTLLLRTKDALLALHELIKVFKSGYRDVAPTALD